MTAPPSRAVEAAVGLLSEHPIVLVVAVAGAGWLLVGAVVAVTFGRMIALAEYEDLADPEPRRLRVIR